MSVKIRLMLIRREGAANADVDRGLRAELERLDAAAPGRFEHHLAYHLPDEPLRVAHKGTYYKGAAPFDAMLEILAADEDVETVAGELEGFAARMGDLIAPSASAVIVGAPHTIVAGSGKLHVAVAARRLPHLDHEGFIGYWFGNHAEEGRKTEQIVSGMGYRQIHIDPAASAAIARRVGLGLCDFDGMSETYFTDSDKLKAVYGAPGVWESAYPDELKFVDHGRSISTLFVMADT